jgi:hypothetical protein
LAYLKFVNSKSGQTRARWLQKLPDVPEEHRSKEYGLAML